MTSTGLGGAAQRELVVLAERYGQPCRVSAHISGAFFDPIKRPDRVGEVCMVIRRPNGKILLSTKDFYPAGAYRLPTGGIDRDEPVLDALLRETREETSLEVEVRRFLAWIEYEAAGDSQAEDLSFRTLAFLLDEIGGELKVSDPRERILDYREVEISELPAVVHRLEGLRGLSSDIVGDWGEWGRFRAVVHRTVYELLT